MDRDAAIAERASQAESAGSHTVDGPISVFLITLNEAAHIEQVLSSVAWADEVIVLDSGSTDGTTDICARMGVQLHHQQWLGYSAQKAAALAKCRNTWCLNIDGDEIVSPDLDKDLVGLKQACFVDDADQGARLLHQDSCLLLDRLIC